MENNIKKAVISNRILLTRTPELVNKVRQELTYKFPPRSPNGAPEIHCDMTFISERIFSIPVTRIDLIPPDYIIKDKRILSPVLYPEFNGELRKSQQDIHDDFDDSAIINAKPGFGKTYTALAILKKLGQKALIITNSIALRDQWVEEINKVFGINPSIIGSSKFNTSAIITVANIQTLNKRAVEVSNTFGAIVIDECHHVAATTFKKTIDKSRARYKIGLSATLVRKDGKGILLKDYISNKVYTPPKENTVDPKIIIRKTNIKIPGGPAMPWANRMNKVYQNRNYLEEVTRMALTQAERGHIVLVLASRIEFLETCGRVTPNSAVITSRTPDRKSVENEVLSGKTPILYASLSIYSEGISRNEFSCVIIATALNNASLLEQIAGRVNRKNEKGRDPELVDIAFAGTTGENQLRTRENFYRKEGWKVVYV